MSSEGQGNWVNTNPIGGVEASDGLFRLPNFNSKEWKPSQADKGKDGEVARETQKKAEPAGNTFDQNRAECDRNNASAANVTGKLRLRGYPALRAKEGVTITNVGPVASGLWYVKSCTHEWSTQSGLITDADLVRSEVNTKGKGGKSKKAPDVGKTGQPIIKYADIRNSSPKNVVITYRNLQSPSQATFTYGDGDYIVSFSFTVQSSKQSGRERNQSTKSLNRDSTQAAVNEQTQNLGVKK